ncbi:heparin lyase I family protein [Pyxidicoccus sp. 3LFB2]
MGPTCTATVGADGCSATFSGRQQCSDSCEPTATCVPQTWQKMAADFSEGLRSFQRVECGGVSGTCPFVDSNQNYTLAGKLTGNTSNTPAPLYGSGCASADGVGCRFYSDGSGELKVSVKPPPVSVVNPGSPSEPYDWVASGPRNELSLLREQCNDTKLYVGEGEVRHYSFSVYIPDETALPDPVPYSQNNSKLSNVVWQVHETGNCVGGGPMFDLAFARADATTGRHTGSTWGWFMYRKAGYVDGTAVTRILPNTTFNLPFIRNAWYHFVVKVVWAPTSGGSVQVWARREGDTAALPMTWASVNHPTLYRWPTPDTDAECDAGEFEYDTTRAPGAVMKGYVKTGLYSKADVAPFHVKLKNVRSALSCADAWPAEMNSAPCPN